MSKPMYKYLAQGAAGGVLFGTMIGFENATRIGGMRVPVPLIGAVLGVAGALVSDVAHDYVIPHLSKDDRLRHVEGVILAPAISAGAFAGGLALMKAGALQEVGVYSALAQGAAAELAGQWVYENFLLPYVGGDYKEAASF